jgi:hypothetical protein
MCVEPQQVTRSQLERRQLARWNARDDGEIRVARRVVFDGLHGQHGSITMIRTFIKYAKWLSHVLMRDSCIDEGLATQTGETVGV